MRGPSIVRKCQPRITFFTQLFTRLQLNISVDTRVDISVDTRVDICVDI